jgi:hypothetical protein
VVPTDAADTAGCAPGPNPAVFQYPNDPTDAVCPRHGVAAAAAGLLLKTALTRGEATVAFGTAIVALPGTIAGEAEMARVVDR